MRVMHERFEPSSFCSEHRPSERQQAIETPPLVGTAAVLDETEIDQARDGGVEGPRAEPHGAIRALLDVLNHGVAVTLTVGERQQDVELMRREREEVFRVVHASNLDVSSLDAGTPRKVGLG